MSSRQRVDRLGRGILSAAILAWAGILPVFAGILIADTGGPDQALYNQGRALVFEEAWPQAREVFQLLLRRHPRSPYLDDALYWTAFALYEEGRPEGAYDTLQGLIEEYPESPWQVDARTLMVRASESALLALAGRQGSGSAFDDPSNRYRKFLEESTRDSNAQVSLMAIDTLLDHEPDKAPDLLKRVKPTSNEGAVVLLDRFFGNDFVKVTFKDRSAGLAEGNVMILVRSGDRSAQLTMGEALDVIAGNDDRRYSQVVVRELREKILEAERSLVTQGPIVGQEHASPVRRRASTIVRVVDGEVHYYDNGAETLRIVVLKRAAGFSPQNVHVFVDGPSGPEEVALEDILREERGPMLRGISADAMLFLRQSLGVIRLDLENSQR